MKKCNLCQSIVNAEEECPICHNTLTYEPTCQETEEHYVWNKYYLLYVLKKIWFSLFCCVFGIIKLVITMPDMNKLLMAAIGCALISLLVSVFQRNLEKSITWKYSEDYAPFKIGVWKYLLGAISLLLFVFA